MPHLESTLPSPASSTVRTRISERLQLAVRTSNQRQYRLAQAIDVHPSTLSGWINGIFWVQDGDPRVIRLGVILGVSASECFAPRVEPSHASPSRRSRPMPSVRRRRDA